MKKQIRLTLEHLEDGKVLESNIVLEQIVKSPKSIKDLGLNHQQQIDLLKGCQDGFLKAQSSSLKEDISECPHCGSKLKFAGSISSDFYSVFTDHKVSAKRQKCCNKECGWTSVPSIRSLFTTNSHPDLSKLQAEMACNHTYREAKRNMNACSYYPRKVNGHNHIRSVVEIVGNYISANQIEKIPNDISAQEELICQVDGGHLKSIEEGQRSFEALTSVVYSPKNVIYSNKKSKGDSELPRGEIISKHCSASGLNDNLVTMKRQTLVAALKQGMTKETKITALCDGAGNCWNVVQSLEGKCGSITKILDWFHIAKRFKNISLPKYLSKKLDKAKWCIWHGQHEKAVDRLDEIILSTRSEKMRNRLIKLQGYLENNKSYLVHYAERYKEGKVISSSLAESTVENLINRRCKGKQHMKWSREGVHPLLQIRASYASNDWSNFGAQYVFHAMTKKAA